MQLFTDSDLPFKLEIIACLHESQTDLHAHWPEYDKETQILCDPLVPKLNKACFFFQTHKEGHDSVNRKIQYK